jgi:hypothetical protein
VCGRCPLYAWRSNYLCHRPSYNPMPYLAPCRRRDVKMQGGCWALLGRCSNCEEIEIPKDVAKKLNAQNVASN